MRVLVNLANQNVDVPQSHKGSQKRQYIERRHVRSGIGTGDHLKLGYQAFVYGGAGPGFAEQNQESYNHIAANLAWSRTLATLQEGFGKSSDLETQWDEIQESINIAFTPLYFSSNIWDPLASYVREGVPSITYTPTLQGAIGRQAIHDFYEKSFVLGKPDNMQMRLLSRTIGADRVVDEIYVHFKHTQHMPWILPDIPPTWKEVHVIIINIVSLRGGLLYSENIYWDQASVLLQVGLLDPTLIAEGHKGVERLPINGSNSAKQILVNDREKSRYIGDSSQHRGPKNEPGAVVHRPFSTDATRPENHTGNNQERDNQNHGS
ncbi:hypothetical protein FE257_003069 [Aspergillus nanangensis]|uniref:Uncharacterized protein n=1 Tax=Aspergillus nanangensis TaxID=2582783 RepID=A0AAD4CC17_ASPNN|nr:hypothetical protein FE257_003069 [Aspergillus nanangensis]